MLPPRLKVIHRMVLYEAVLTVVGLTAYLVSVPLKAVRFCLPRLRFDQVSRFANTVLCYAMRPLAGVPRNVDESPAGLYALTSALAPNMRRPTPGAPDLHCLSALSALAYDDEGVVRAQCQRWCTSDLTFLQMVEVRTQPFLNQNGPVDTQAYLFLKDKTLVICFRGSSPLEMIDWATDFNMRMEPAGYGQPGRVHVGFRRALGLSTEGVTPDGAFDKIMQAIRNLPVPAAGGHTSVAVTGHSLGGALAMVFGAQFFQVAQPKQAGRIVTFGGPRVGDAEFADGVNALASRVSVTRVINGNDIVPRECPLALGYRHPGEAIHLDTFGKPVTLSAANREQPPLRWGTAVIKLFRGVWRGESILRLGFRFLGVIGSLPFLGFGNHINDHVPADYEIALR